MSGWQLGLVLFGTLLAGFGFGIVTVYFYARHVFRTKMGMLAGQLLNATPGGQSVTITRPPPIKPPPPPTRNPYENEPL